MTDYKHHQRFLRSLDWRRYADRNSNVKKAMEEKCLKNSQLNLSNVIQSVPGGMWQTSGECSLC